MDAILRFVVVVQNVARDREERGSVRAIDAVEPVVLAREKIRDDPAVVVGVMRARDR